MTWLFPTIAWTLAALALALLAWALFWDRARGRKRCPKCWYDMGGAAPDDAGAFTCPECGRSSHSERKLRRTRRRYVISLLAILIMLPSAHVISRTSQIRERGFAAAFPTSALILMVPAARLWSHFISSGPAQSPTDPPLFAELKRRLPGAQLWELQLLAWRLDQCRVALGFPGDVRVHSTAPIRRGWAFGQHFQGDPPAGLTPFQIVPAEMMIFTAEASSTNTLMTHIHAPERSNAGLLVHAEDTAHDFVSKVIEKLGEDSPRGPLRIPGATVQMQVFRTSPDSYHYDHIAVAIHRAMLLPVVWSDDDVFTKVEALIVESLLYQPWRSEHTRLFLLDDRIVAFAPPEGIDWLKAVIETGKLPPRPPPAPTYASERIRELVNERRDQSGDGDP